jgi:hypothetical protein
MVKLEAVKRDLDISDIVETAILRQLREWGRGSREQQS